MEEEGVRTLLGVGLGWNLLERCLMVGVEWRG